MMSYIVVAVLLVSSLLLVQGAVPADEITSLPGWTGPLPTRHYSGYFETYFNGNGTRGGYLHYWLTLSEGSPATDPLVMWIQGGPGCSSLFGLLYENGQINLTPNVTSAGLPTLTQNPWAWTKKATMLWLEQPLGVGFSYCTSGQCSNANFDTDAYYFLQNFFAAYPELFKLDFHISGESYAGFYVPHLADAIVTGNALGNNPIINLKGLIIGNGVGGTTEPNEALRRENDFWYGHVAIDYPDELKIEDECDWNGTISTTCRNAVSGARNEVGTFYVYNIYDHCDHDQGVSKKLIKDLTEMEQALYLHAPIDPANTRLGDMGYVCVLDSVSDHYLDDAGVQAAIHVTQAGNNHWTQCGGREGTKNWELVKAHRKHMADRGALAPDNALGDLYVKLLNTLPIVLYSGDVDQCVPTYGTDNWVRQLNYRVKSAWTAWTFGQRGNIHTGGYWKSYAAPHTFTFVTVRDSGHMVPEYQPEAALTLFSNYLAGMLTNIPVKKTVDQ